MHSLLMYSGQLCTESFWSDCKTNHPSRNTGKFRAARTITYDLRLNVVSIVKMGSDIY